MNNKLLAERVSVLHNILSTTVEHYFSPDINEGQRGLYETILGAAIWYLPSGDELFSGKISSLAIESLRNNPATTKLVEEHSFPRKVGGKYLYELYRHHQGTFTETDLIEIYKKTLGKFNLVLKSENDKLKKWQKFKNSGLTDDNFLETASKIEDFAYGKAEISLTEFSPAKYKEFKQYKAKLGRKNSKLDKSSLTFVV
jgi:uncharacterized protein YegP (UPF0339 family)